jgi:pimeloyl-ACP methyl ester carboxylesterase
MENLDPKLTAPLQSAASFDGAAIAFRDFGGPGPALVMIPGWSCIQEMWDPCIAFLAPKFRVVTLDYAGNGHSTTTEREWALENLARDVRAVIERLDLHDVTVVGHSMGGGVALETAYLCNDRVSRVIGCDTLTYSGIYRRLDERAMDAALAPLRADYAGSVRSMMSVYFIKDGDPAIEAYATDVMAGAAPKVAVPTMENLMRWDVDESLARCPVPVSLVNARPFLDPAIEEQYKDRIDIRTIDGVGHFLMLDKPAEFAAALTMIMDGAKS